MASPTEDELWNFTPRSDEENEDENMSNRSGMLRDKKPHEYRPVPVGGFAVYYNEHSGSQDRSKVPSKDQLSHFRQFSGYLSP